MKNLSLLTFVLLAASPLAAAAWPEEAVTCGRSDRTYAGNSTYEANLHRLAAVLPAEAAASRGRTMDRAIGYWPNRLQASASCWSSDGDCAACVAEAFKEVQRVCPFRREAYFFGRNCDLRISEFHVFGNDFFGADVFGNRVYGHTMVQELAMVMIFQAFGLACLFFLFIQFWRHDSKKGIMTRHTHTPILPGDQ